MLAAGLMTIPSVSDAASDWWEGSSISSAFSTSFTEVAHRRHRHHHHKRTVQAAAAPSGSATGTSGTSSATGGSTPTGTPPADPSTTPSGTTSGTTSGSTSGSSTSTAAPSSPAGTASRNGPFIPYGPNSFLQRPLPASTPVSADNARLVQFAKSDNPDAYLKIRGANGVGWGIAYGEADCSDPLYKIGPGGNLPPGQEHLRTVGFHAPAAMWKNIPPNSDAPFLVMDRCGTSARPAGLSVWGANTAVSGSTVTISAAGSFSHDSNGLDSRNPAADSTLNARSRGVIPDSMAIRLDALDAAIRNGSGLGYVVEVFWSETDSAAGFASPMVGAEGGKGGAGAEGQRFRIKPGIDLASRPGCNPTTNPVGLAIARTLQQNGAYIGDNSGSGSGIKTEQNANYPGLTADSLRGCMTWDDIEFLPLGWTG
jgi:hypothetical protein